MNPAEVRAPVDRYLDACNRRGVDGTLRGIRPQVEFQNVSAGVVNASINRPAQLRTLAQQWRLPRLLFAPSLPAIRQTA
ncbi:MAG: hypothetical protein FJ191_09180 [Gammaproteobacteria bacterium]|nr:hypothetical protein [Gammaproteobacteria bacterium]